MNVVIRGVDLALKSWKGVLSQPTFKFCKLQTISSYRSTYVLRLSEVLMKMRVHSHEYQVEPFFLRGDLLIDISICRMTSERNHIGLRLVRSFDGSHTHMSRALLAEGSTCNPWETGTKSQLL